MEVSTRAKFTSQFPLYCPNILPNFPLSKLSSPCLVYLAFWFESWASFWKTGYRCNILLFILVIAFLYHLQAQRDYFGAHTYELLSNPGKFVHTNWTGHGGDVSSTTYQVWMNHKKKRPMLLIIPRLWWECLWSFFMYQDPYRVFIHFLLTIISECLSNISLNPW